MKQSINAKIIVLIMLRELCKCADEALNERGTLATVEKKKKIKRYVTVQKIHQWVQTKQW